MLGADCLALLPAGPETLEAGTRVQIELLRETPLAGEVGQR
jgi:molybdopterin biosynthesis enzyme